MIAVMIHEDSGLGSCERNLKKICKDVSFENGLAVHGADAERSESTVAAWRKKYYSKRRIFVKRLSNIIKGKCVTGVGW